MEYTTFNEENRLERRIKERESEANRDEELRIECRGGRQKERVKERRYLIPSAASSLFQVTIGSFIFHQQANPSMQHLLLALKKPTPEIEAGDEAGLIVIIHDFKGFLCRNNNSKKR